MAVRKYAVPQAQALSFLLGDHLGSTSLVTDSAGATIAETRYSAWGETRYSSGVSLTNYKYTGQREESSFGLYFYNARWYDSQTGRFNQPDTITLLPQKDAKQANTFIALTVDFQETEILKYVNGLNYKKMMENMIQPPEKDKRSRNRNVLQDDSSEKNTTDLRKSIQLDDRSKSYTPDETSQVLSALNKIGKAPQHNGQNKDQQDKISTFDDNQELPLDLIYSNALDRYSYARNCPSRYTDPSGHKDCNLTKLAGGAVLILGSEAIATGIALWTSTASGPVGFVETFEFTNKLFTPAFVVGAVAMAQSGCIGIDIPPIIDVK